MKLQIWSVLAALLLTAVLAKEMGYTSPKGSIYLLVGETLHIVCVINLDQTKGYNSSRLNFYNGGPVNPKYVSILNESAIALDIPNAEPTNSIYMCKQRQDTIVGIAMNDVQVGYKPEHVQNFRCRSYNWQNMTCTFETVPNPVTCQSELKFRLDNVRDVFSCIVRPMFDNKTFSCTLNAESKGGIYRQPYDMYYFTLKSKNKLGEFTEEFKIDHFAIVIPDNPQNLTGTDIQPSSTKLSWRTPIEMQFFPKGLYYSISYLTEFDHGIWTNLEPFLVQSAELTKPIEFMLNNLPYAYVQYDVRVRSRSELAANTAEMWSRNATYLFTSGARVPDAPPRTDAGGFFVDDNDHIYIYWKELDKFRQNGPQFKYIVRCTSHPMLQRSMNNAFMEKYAAVSVNRHDDIEFTIWSNNSVGSSKKSSSIRVPRKSDRCEPPGEIRNILHNKNEPDRKYVFSWSAPKNDSYAVSSYTVFWCMARNESPNQCDGSFDFERVPSHITSFERVTNHTLNFAVSANTHTSSSGMVWARCTAIANNDINKVTDTKTNAGSEMATFEWNTACIDESLSHGYQITYCRVKGDRDNTNCTETQKTHSIIGAAIHNYTLNHLTPYSTYKVTIAAQSLDKLGPLSDPVYFTTLESSPSPPLSLMALNVNSSTVTLQWDPPAEMNGVLNRYSIYYNNHRVEAPKVGNATDRITYVLTGLMANTNYDITVIACTGARHCSNSSNPVSIRTYVGVPGNVQIESIDHNVIRWKAPMVAAGNLDYYEMLVTSRSMAGDQTAVVYLKGTSCTILSVSVNCQMNETHVFSVRAVNVMYTPHAVHMPSEELATELEQKYIDVDTLTTDTSVSRHEKRHSSYEPNPLHNSFNNVIDQQHPSDTKPPHRPVHPKICVEEDQEIPNRIRRRDKHASLLMGDYVIVRNERCGMSTGMMYPLVLFVVFGILVVTYLFVRFAFKKIKKIKDIDIDMPDGMKEIIQDSSNGKSIGGGLGALEIGRISDTSRSDKLLTRAAEQEESLLPWQHNHSVSSINSGDEERISQCDDEAPLSCSDTGDDLRSARTTTESLVDEKSFSNQSSQNDAFRQSPSNPFNGSPIVMPVMTTFSPTMVPPQVQRPMSTFSSNHNYVPAAVLMCPPTTNANGYVTHDAIAAKAADLACRQQQPLNSGYMPHSVAISTKSPVSPIAGSTPDDLQGKVSVVALTDGRGISGYVTHKQLSDFGQLIQ